MELKCDGAKKVPFQKWVDGDLACKDGSDESSSWIVSQIKAGEIFCPGMKRRYEDTSGSNDISQAEAQAIRAQLQFIREQVEKLQQQVGDCHINTTTIDTATTAILQSSGQTPLMTRQQQLGSGEECSQLATNLTLGLVVAQSVGMLYCAFRKWGGWTQLK